MGTLAKGHVSCLSTFSKDFSKSTGLISFKFHMQPPSKGGGGEGVGGGGEEESLYISSMSHDQDGRHVHIC